MLTEYEWRKQVNDPIRRPAWVGAQCIYPPVWQKKLFHNRNLQRVMLLISLIMFVSFLFQPVNQPLDISEIAVEETSSMTARNVSAVRYQRPDGLEYERKVLSRSQLVQGKMMLLDENHPMPADAIPPNTASIVKRGNGMIPVRSLDVRTGYETIDALKALFAALREKGIGGIYVSRGTVSVSQQRMEAISCMRQLMQNDTPDTARQLTWSECEWPGTGEFLREHTVELCLIDPVTNQQQMRPMEETEQGQALLQLAWRYGWVRSDPDHPYRFRYVGKAHATAMTYLALSLEEYLTLLHQQRVMVITAGGVPQYLILCQPLEGERIAFDLPLNATYEASMDNTGYAVVACTF